MGSGFVIIGDSVLELSRGIVMKNGDSVDRCL